MKGKIIFYSEEKGEGILIAEDKKKHKFNIMEWQDFDNMPKMGITVEFELGADDMATEINVIEAPQPQEQNTNDSTNNNQETKDNQSTTENKQVVTKKNPDQQQNTDKKKVDATHDLTELEHIPIEFTIKEVLGDYFGKATNAIKNEGVNKKSNLLDYSLMKRFLNTAYNHLADKDPSFVDAELMGLKVTLEEMHHIFNETADKKQFPELKFETVFLKYQKIYQMCLREFEKNKGQFQQYNTAADTMSKKIKTAEKKLRELPIKSKEYSDLDLNTKQLRSKYVRMLDAISHIEKANKKLKTLMEDFKVKYEIDFVREFKAVAEKTFEILTISLNSKAYKFDQYMWEMAKKSQGIKKFFLEANIEGGFSSKTFLKYYLSNLDKSKLNAEHKDMYKLLEYLESMEKRQILIVDDKFDILPSLTYFANHIDREFKVTSAIPSDAIRQAFNTKIEYMIVNINIKKIKLFEFIQSINRLERGIDFILISDSFTKELVVKAKKLGVTHFVATKVSDEVLFKNLEKVIKENEEKI
jgi:ActR/RegA family two-component response regulator